MGCLGFRKGLRSRARRRKEVTFDKAGLLWPGSLCVGWSVARSSPIWGTRYVFHLVAWALKSKWTSDISALQRGHVVFSAIQLARHMKSKLRCPHGCAVDGSDMSDRQITQQHEASTASGASACEARLDSVACMTFSCTSCRPSPSSAILGEGVRIPGWLWAT